MVPAGSSLFDVLWAHVESNPFDLFVTAIFFFAIIHTFLAAKFTEIAHRMPDGVLAELLHFAGEVEVIFGLWAVPLIGAMVAHQGWDATTAYFDRVEYTEALFVVVVMALASTGPIVALAEGMVRRIAGIGGGTPAAWWFTILAVAPVLGSFITEPAAMTIAALLLARQFYDLQPGERLKYATLGLLFVNVSIGGTLTHFAAPPVLMVARPWGWDTSFMLAHFGWRAMLSIVTATTLYFIVFRRELKALALRQPVIDIDKPDEESPSPTALPAPTWITLVHVAFLGWTVLNAHHPGLFIGGFLFFLGFARATALYQSRLDLRPPLLVGFFLGGLVIHGGMQKWWIGPVLSSLSEIPMFVIATILTGFNDNALITYLGTLVPMLDDRLKMALLEGAVTGGGLTVIANAPNPIGQSILGKFFDGAVHPWWLFLAAVLPTLIAAAAFRLL